MKNIKKVREAERVVRIAGDNLHRIIAREIPVNSIVEYTHGRRTRSVRVVGHCYGDDVIVKSLSTGKRYRLSAWRITGVS